MTSYFLCTRYPQGSCRLEPHNAVDEHNNSVIILHLIKATHSKLSRNEGALQVELKDVFHVTRAAQFIMLGRLTVVWWQVDGRLAVRWR